MIKNEFIKNFILKSDLIEGLIYNEPALLLKTSFDKNKGHWGAIAYIKRLVERDVCLQESDIIKIQELMLTEQKRFVPVPENYIGQYRKINVMIRFTNIIFPNFARVPSMIKRFIIKTRKWQTSFSKHCSEQNIEIIGRFHHDFEKIHPFADGNGRTGRIIALYMILYAELSPFVFTNADKHETYYPAFEHRNKMASYFVKKYKENKNN